MSSSKEVVPELQKNIQIFVQMLKDGPIEVQRSMLQTFQLIGSSGKKQRRFYNNEPFQTFHYSGEAKKQLKKYGCIKELVRCVNLGGEIRQLALNVLGFTISKDGWFTLR